MKRLLILCKLYMFVLLQTNPNHNKPTTETNIISP